MTSNEFYKNPTIEIDTHTHSILSGHAFSTLEENVKQASEIGLKGLCNTEHAFTMEDTTVVFLPHMFDVIDRNMLGVKLYMGMELNILNMNGDIDSYEQHYLDKLEFCIASLHFICFDDDSTDLTDFTDAYTNAIRNPNVDILGHPGNPSHPCNITEVVSAVKKENKLVEINNHSFKARAGSTENCIEFAKECMKQDVRICVSSDAHFSRQIAHLPLAFEMLSEINFPPELILNRTLTGFEGYLAEREKRILAL